MTRVIRPLTCRFCLTLILLLFLVAFAALPTAALEPRSEFGGSTYAPGEVVIGWQPDSGEVPRGAPPKGFHTNRASADWQAAARTLEARTGLTVLDADPYFGRARLSAPPGQEQAEIARLSTLPWIEYAEPNYIAYVADTYPSDPYFGRQWNMRRVYAPAAWDLGMGTDSIVVAVVDSGIDLNHPEFSGRILEGYDYVRGDSEPNDEYDHGTHVSGIVAAEANNGVGVVGLAANVRILPLKVLDNTGSGWYYDIGSAIQRAAAESAQIINLSLQGTYDSLDMRAAVLSATQQGCLVVAAAGNCAQGGLNCNNTSNPVIYPAAYPEVLAVAATDLDDNRASYSGYKPYVGLAAPGGISSDPIWSTVRQSQGGYSSMYGTSMATPMVSAAAALVWTFLPTPTATQVADVLKQTADKVGAYAYVNGRNDYLGYGRLNIGRAVRTAYPPSLSPIPGATQKFLLGGSVQQSSGQVSLVNPSEQPVAWQASVLQGADWLTLSASSGSGVATFSAPGRLSFEVDSTGLLPGQYPGLIRVLYDNAQHSLEIPVQLQVAAALYYGFIPHTPNAFLPVNWFDPLPGGQSLDLTDNSVIQVPLPFLVSFYGQTYSSIWVSDNGIALFTIPAKAGAFDPANCMPSAARPNDAFYVLWHDWVPELGGGVYVHQPNSDTFVITWDEMARPGITAPHSFQLVLTRAGGVLFQYQAVDSPLEGTIGIENFDGTLAQEVLCSGAGRQVRSGDALLMNPAVPW